ncbi:helix-turn-helix transcriptional regulator [Hymenobacter sp. HSC-4F20]|uniref:helix-turn-helix transcriptional regulator n=1 Tax=Hymenobacter sp. HSC-4F20 TaxID=2864135 RepID=UPI001C72E858|nr:helix-turn-helix transcriptional regulator [Hymenobacter sp. HSC-4F20]MBX0293108.1 helix-turn-helix transcriptional regulator [Hymenobacter sp. HSC-4F20]
MLASAPSSNSEFTKAPISLLRYCTQTPAPRARVLLPQHMFTFLLAGEKTVYFAGAQVTIQPQQFVLLAAGNCLMSEKIAAPATEYHSLLLLFDHQVLADFCHRHAAWLGQPDQHAASQPFLRFEQNAFLATFVRSLDCLLTEEAAAIPQQLQRVKLEELLLYLALHYPGQFQQLRRLGQEANEEVLVRQAVTSHIGSPVAVAELAFLCHMSLSTFKRRFAQLYGTSPRRWLLERRMEKAATLLRQADRNVSELSDELGYENLSSFIQSFKQFYGVTPKQYQGAG